MKTYICWICLTFTHQVIFFNTGFCFKNHISHIKLEERLIISVIKILNSNVDQIDLTDCTSNKPHCRPKQTPPFLQSQNEWTRIGGLHAWICFVILLFALVSPGKAETFFHNFSADTYYFVGQQIDMTEADLYSFKVMMSSQQLPLNQIIIISSPTNTYC